MVGPAAILDPGGFSPPFPKKELPVCKHSVLKEKQDGSDINTSSRVGVGGERQPLENIVSLPCHILEGEGRERETETLRSYGSTQNR